MSHTESCKEEDNELLEDWTLVEFQEHTHLEEDEQDDDESTEGAVTPPEEEEEEVEVTEEEVEEEEEGQKVEDIKGDEDSSEKKVRKRKVDKTEEKELKEIEASESSEDALQKKTDEEVSTPQDEFNKRLNKIIIVILVVVSLLGLGHFIGIVDLGEDVEPGWSSRSLWEENLNAAQILEKLKLENEDLQERILELQAENTEPFKIKGREGKEGRSLREKVNHLIMENEDMRLALSRHQFSVLPDGDKAEFNKESQENHHFRTSVQQLKHLVPDVNKLEVSLEYLKDEHKELLKTVGKIRHEQTIPKELTPLIKQLEEMRTVVSAEAKKKNPPSTISNARSYIAYMSQVLSAFTFLHEMEEKSAAEKIDLARDIFTYWLPKGIKVPPKIQDDVVKARSHFSAVKSSIRKKWKQLKELTKPETIVEVGQSTVAKMNRVIVNVVNKLKDIGQSTIMSSNKQFEQSVLALSSGLSKLNKQFDETWKSLEIRISMGDRGEDDTEDDDDGEEEEQEVDSGYDDEDDDDDDDDDDEENDDPEEEDIIEDRSNENAKVEIETESIKKDIITDKMKHVKKPEEEKKAPPKQTDAKSKSQTDKQQPSTLESEEIKEEIQKQIKNKEFEKFRGKSDTKPEYQKDKKVPPKRNGHHQNLKQSVEEKVVHPQKEKSIKNEDQRDYKKDSKTSLKDKIREKKEEQKLIKEDSRYFKGQYNKFDKVKDGADKEVPDFTRKYYRKTEDDDDDDDDDDEDDYDSKTPKKATGLKRHWEKPQKKSYFREQSGPKKQFIRRRGKECYWDQYHDKNECSKPVKRWEQIREGKKDDNKISKKFLRNDYTKKNKFVKQAENNKKSRDGEHRRENVKCERAKHRNKRDQYSKSKDDKVNKRHFRYEDEKQIHLVNQVKNNRMGKKKKIDYDKIEDEKYSTSRKKENKKTKNKKSKVPVDSYKGKKVDFKLKTRGLSSR